MTTSHTRYQAPRQDGALRRSGVTYHTQSYHSSLTFPTPHLKEDLSLARNPDGNNKTFESFRA